MSQQQLPSDRSAKTTQGPIDRVPCPWCSKPNDYRIMQSQQLLDTGGEHFCDYCGHSMIVVAIRTIEVVAVKRDPSGKRSQTPTTRRAQAQAQQQARQLAGQPKPGLLQRLLGKGNG